MMVLLSAISIFLLSYGITTIVVPYMISIAGRYNIVDNPDGKLKTHKSPTPYLGGIAVYLGFMSGLALFFPVLNQMCFALIGSTLLLFVGLVDDLIVLTPRQKWYGQVLATCCFVRGGFYLKEIFLSAYMPTFAPYVWAVLSALWILTIINAFNLLDVMDGLATTTALCVASSLCVIAYTLQASASAQMLLALCGALVAFLRWNRPAAHIYLGDAGSLFVGGVLAIAPFTIPWGHYYYLGFLTPIIIFFIPLIEVFSLIIIRTLRGIPWYCGSPDHFCMYLKKNGWNNLSILKFVFIFSATLLLFGCFFVHGRIDFIHALLLGTLLNLAWLYIVFAPRRFKIASFLSAN